MVKKILALVMVMSVVGSALVGCAPRDDAATTDPAVTAPPAQTTPQ
jgi:hypothetical protein